MCSIKLERNLNFLKFRNTLTGFVTWGNVVIFKNTIFKGKSLTEAVRIFA